MSSEADALAIRADGLGKCYAIYESPRDRLKQFVLPRLGRAIGRAPARYYREFWALREVSFAVRRGETFGIVGRNGSGKSTLLQLLCGTLLPSSGTVSVQGRVAALLELGAGFNPEFSGRENVYMNGQVLGLTREQVDERFDRIAAFADIGAFMDRPVKTYSSGMYVRLAFAVVAHVDADILVVDEALSVGDAYFVQKCMRFLRGFMERGTLLFVSHDTSAVVNLCSRAMLLQKGRLEMIGSPRDVTRHYLAALYSESQDVAGAAAATPEPASAPVAADEWRDMRQDLIDSSRLRNDIEVFRFSPDASGFGTGLAKIESVVLRDAEGRPLSWVVGGSDVRLSIRCRASAPLARPIVGFEVKDRLGQTIFADNTALAYRDRAVPVPADGLLTATFDFRLPVLPSGDYSVGVAVADGLQEDHVQHHWMHDALIVRVHASSVCFGLVGVPMRSITLEAAS